MYNTKLNEFEPNQLNELLFVVDDKIKEINGKIQAVSNFEDGPIKHDIENALNKAFNTFVLWKVQLEMAKNDIEEMNKISAG